MGTPSSTTPIADWNMLYSTVNPLSSSLVAPITEDELVSVIRAWPSNKSPGPDGFTGEFFKFFQKELTSDLLLTINQGLQCGSLFPLNNSFIALIPKTENPTTPADFRPISVVSSLQRLTSKILANRLQPFIPSLVSDSQSGFVRGRLITENFLYAQHVTHLARKTKLPLALFKADIHKVFDTVSWSFIHSILLALGFPSLWADWMVNCVLSGSSKVIVNGVAGKTLPLKRGVRQGDPLSPYLFILAMDFLTRWLHNLVMVGALSLPLPGIRPCLLYADGALFFLKPSVGQLALPHTVLLGFQAVSRLSVNQI